ncbi:MAG: hypothetical protein SH821_14540 [Phototrophicales bacterium]|nr:hypothetical protein [Phototrophicales bacterium]
MSPIVYGLEEQYRDQLAVRFLNALDGAEGQTTFNALALPGHPSYVLYDELGVEVWRGFGIIVQAYLQNEIEKIID